ncbi:hypothetical protein V6N13_101301 [Hibiscus sabdariffa]
MPGSSPSAEGQSTNMKVCSLVRPSADTPTCGKYGHAKEVCGIAPPTETIAAEANVQRNPDDLYGPWMQVPKRRRRNGSFRKDFDYANTYNGRFVESDSRFATLANVSDSIGHEDESTPRTHNWVRVGYISDASGVDGVAQNSEGSSLLEGQLVVKSRKDIEGNTVAWEVPVRVASQGRVVAAKSSLNAEKNVVVQNVGPKKKKRDVQNSSTPTLAVGLSNLMEDITNVEVLENSKLGASSSNGVGDIDSVSWIKNLAFVQAPASNM